jgi:hypothetical protein
MSKNLTLEFYNKLLKEMPSIDEKINDNNQIFSMLHHMIQTTHTNNYMSFSNALDADEVQKKTKKSNNFN